MTPLTDKEILELALCHRNGVTLSGDKCFSEINILRFARAIEAAACKRGQEDMRERAALTAKTGEK